jgi:hypothetical protein
VQDNTAPLDSVILQVAQNTTWRLFRRLAAERLQIRQESRMIGDNSLTVYLAEVASIAHLHWANHQALGLSGCESIKFNLKLDSVA